MTKFLTVAVLFGLLGFLLGQISTWGPSTTPLGPGTFTFMNEGTKCLICEINCQAEPDLFESPCPRGNYFRYGCHNRDYCLNTNSFSYQQSFAATLVCMAYNGCKLKKDPQNRTLFERSSYYRLYVTDLQKFGLSIALDDICNPDTGSDPQDARCAQVSYAAKYEKYRAYKNEQLEKYFKDLGGSFNVRSEMKRRAFVRLGVPPAFFFFFKILQDYKDGVFDGDNTQYLDNVRAAIAAYHQYYNDIKKGAPYTLHFGDNYFDVIANQLKKEGGYRLDRIYSLIATFVEARLNAMNTAKALEDKILAMGGVLKVDDVEVLKAMGAAVDEQLSAKSALSTSKEVDPLKKNIGRVVRVGGVENAQLQKEKEIADFNAERTKVLRTIYIELEKNLLADYKKLWASWTNINVNRYFVDVAVFGEPGDIQHKSTVLGVECPANSEKYAEDDKGGYCCVGTLSGYSVEKQSYLECLGVTVCSITPGNKGNPGCSNMVVAAELVSKFNKQELPVSVPPVKIPSDPDSRITADKWYTGFGQVYRNINRIPSKSDVEAVSPLTAWLPQEGDAPVVKVESLPGSNCAFRDIAGMYAFGYVWIPEKGKVTFRVVSDDYSWGYINDVKIADVPCCGAMDFDISDNKAIKRGDWNKVYGVGADGCGKGYLSLEFLMTPHYPAMKTPSNPPSHEFDTLSLASSSWAMGRTGSLSTVQPGTLREIEGLSPPAVWASDNPSPSSLTLQGSTGGGLFGSLTCFTYAQAGYRTGFIWVPYTGKLTVTVATKSRMWLDINGEIVKNSDSSFTMELNQHQISYGAWNKFYIATFLPCYSTVTVSFSYVFTYTDPVFVQEPNPDSSGILLSQWYTGSGYSMMIRNFFNMATPPSKEEVEKVSPPLRWDFTKNPSGPIVISGRAQQDMSWLYIVGVYAQGYVWIPTDPNAKYEIVSESKLAWIYINKVQVAAKTTGTVTLDITSKVNRGQWNHVYAVGAVTGPSSLRLTFKQK